MRAPRRENRESMSKAASTTRLRKAIILFGSFGESQDRRPDPRLVDPRLVSSLFRNGNLLFDVYRIRPQMDGNFIYGWEFREELISIDRPTQRHRRAHHAAPQNTTEKPFSTSDLDAIRGELSKILTKRCQDFIDKLLTKTGELGGDAPVKTSILDLFDMVRNQGGFVSATLEERGLKIGCSTGDGAVGANNAKVLLSSTSDLYRQPLRISYHAFNALSELTHVAGSKASGYYTGTASDAFS